MHTKRKIRISLLAATLVAGATAVYLPATQAASQCSNSLVGSSFEIDPSANLKVDTSGCIDWLAGGTDTDLRTNVLAKPDKGSGAGDDSFGRGTAENDADPQIVSGSIPPNKSDLSTFGVFSEGGSGGKFLELFWARVQNPSGTTNMDFELNQNFCDPGATPTNCANNGKSVTPETPVRTDGDKLISYDLSKGGTTPTISIRTWAGSAWGAPTVISHTGPPPTVACDPNDPHAITQCAIGSVNSSLIPSNEADSIGVNGLSPFTFGEAVISYAALFSGNTCGNFGSAYLKSRSSDSFTSEIKDFVAPESVSISNCTMLTTSSNESVVIGSAVHDTATLSGATSDATGPITFKLFNDAQCTDDQTHLIYSTTLNVSGNNDYGPVEFTPLAIGTYYWIASYSGDAGNAASTGKCQDAGEVDTVVRAPASISTTQSLVPQDSATVSGGLSAPTGSVTFSLFGPQATPDCSGAPVIGPLTRSLDASGTATTNNSTAITADGTYNWLVSYSGDDTHEANPGVCGAEHFNFTITNG